MTSIKNLVIATVAGAIAVTIGNVGSSLILNRIYSPSEEKVKEVDDFINNINE